MGKYLKCIYDSHQMPTGLNPIKQDYCQMTIELFNVKEVTQYPSDIVPGKLKLRTNIYRRYQFSICLTFSPLAEI